MPQRDSLRPLGRFLLLTFGLSWSAWFLGQSLGLPQTLQTLAVTLGPALAAWWTPVNGRRVTPDWRWRPDASLTLVLALPLTTAATALGFGGALPWSAWPSLLSLYLMQLATVALWEELGWRHWLQRYLQGRYPLALAIGATALCWLCWHGPKLWLLGRDGAVLVVLILASAVLLGLLWRRCDGALWPVVLLHGALNAPLNWVERYGGLALEALVAGWWRVALGYAGLALLAALIWRRRQGERRAGGVSRGPTAP
ncbi:CPBP family intramembrane glutamic endopeptidase [Ferrimonas balearica]|uniref:CPBP family intramembrane glutamic endopeptidase n=1 Tax=Ferrimonas balearica TaxID=44012 RepID=UPI001C99BFA5|nr:CPBP family intramembrane glutamic endopeptidase [Ferrimonas balearica]MBY5990949.1 CPBP family intramembrane metalloprotease [Ferrimonas balearica]